MRNQGQTYKTYQPQGKPEGGLGMSNGVDDLITI
jgi:hypothetical protein